MNTKGTIVKKTLPVIYIIDTSTSMRRERIAAVNEAMRDSIEIMQEKAKENADVAIKVGVLTFSNGCRWLSNKLVDIEDFYWTNISADGLTDLGFALLELNDKLSEKGYLNFSAGYVSPVLVFITDGYPTDDWKGALTRINKENPCFKNAIKVCVAIDNNTDIDALAQLAGNSNGVIKADNLEALKSFIVAVSATSSMMRQSHLVGDPEVELSKQAFDKLKEKEGIEFIEITDKDNWDEGNSYSDDDSDWE